MRRGLNVLLCSIMFQVATAAFAGSSPVVTAVPPPNVLIGETFTFRLSFDNTSASVTGFGPYIDLFIPANGVDGALGLPKDGISFNSATYLGVNLTSTVLTFAGGTITHPYAKTLAGTPLVLTLADFPGAQNGDQVVVVELPYGSFTPTQPAADCDISCTMSNLADLAVPLTMYARGGFRYGDDALENPAVDPSIIGPRDTDAVTPQLIILTKVFDGPEGETATGPNFPRTYTLRADIATGQTVTNLRLTDVLPPQTRYLSLGAASPGGGSLTTTPVPGTPANTGGTFQYTFPSITGVAGVDASVQFSFYVPRLAAPPLAPVIIDADNGDDAGVDNNVTALYDWPNPVDVRDRPGPTNVLLDPMGFENTFIAKSIAIQKGQTTISDVGFTGPTPGDIIECTLTVQVSDYFAFQNLIVSDVISDGQRLINTPTLAVLEHGVPIPSANFAGPNFTVMVNGDGILNNGPANEGTTDLTLRLSNEMISRGFDGKLVGGAIPNGGTGGPPPVHPDGVLPFGATIATITYRVQIQDTFSDAAPSGERSLNARDELTNVVQIQGDLLQISDVTALTGQNEADGSSARLVIAHGSLIKSIYAINGSTVLPSPLQVSPGDTLTYQLRYTLPTGDAENLQLRDFLPLPIFKAGDPNADGVAGPAWVFDAAAGINGSVPATGVAKFGPAETFRTVSGIIPTVSINVANGNNTLLFYDGVTDFAHLANTPLEIDILFTVTVDDDPYVDGLFMTNQAQSSEGSTQQPSQEINDNKIVQIFLNEPSVQTPSKGIVGYEGTGKVAGAFTFDAPTSAGTNFLPAATVVTPADLTALGGLNELTNVIDAGDKVRYAIGLRNDGRSDAFDVRIGDQVPVGFIKPPGAAGAAPGGLNIVVRRGTTGHPALTAGVDYTVNYVPATGAFTVELTDNFAAGPGTQTGALNRGKDINGLPMTDGSNIVIVTYDLVVDVSAHACSTIRNTSSLVNFAGKDGGPDHTLTDLTDTADINLRHFALAKSVTSETWAGNNATNQVVIGELVSTTLTLTVPEGSSPNCRIRETLPAGLAFVDVTAVSAPGVTASLPTVSATPANTTISAGGTGNIDFNLGTITNNNTVNGAVETIVITYRSVVMNINAPGAPFGNQAGVALSNSAVFTHDYQDQGFTPPPPLASCNGGAAAVGTVNVIEPALTALLEVSANNVAYGATINTVDAGDFVFYRLRLTNAAGGVLAWDMSLVNSVLPTAQLLPASLTVLSTAVTNAAGLGGGSVLVNNAGAVPTPNTHLIIDGTNALVVAPATTIDLLPDTRLEIVVRGTLAGSVSPGLTPINYSLQSRWTSKDGAVANLSVHTATGDEERTGSGGVGTDAAVLNNYAVNTATVVTTIRSCVLTKQLDQTSEAHTADPAVAIGEVVRYRLKVELPEGTSNNFQLMDNIPNGITFLNDNTARVAFVSAGGAGISSSTVVGAGLGGNELTVDGLNPTATLPVGGVSAGPFATGTDVTFSLGNLVNNDGDSDLEFVVLEFNALVDNGAGATSNDINETHVNNFIVRIGGFQNGATSNNITTTVQEPALTIAKSIVTTPTDAGDTVAYRLVVTNANNANNTNAFNAQVTDPLPATLTLNLASVTVILAGGAAGVTNNSAGNTVDVLIANMPRNSTVTIDYTATVVATDASGLTITNTGTVVYTSLPGTNGSTGNATGSDTPGAPGSVTGERTGSGVAPNDYTANNSRNFTLGVATVDKRFKDGTVSNDDTNVTTTNLGSVVVGEAILYDILVTLREGTTQNLRVQDLVPTGWRLDTTFNTTGYQIITTAAASGGQLAADFSNPAAVAAPTLAVFGLGTLGQDGVDTRLTFGNVVVSADNVTNNNAFLIRLRVIVTDILGNQAGTVRTDTATLTYVNPNTALDATVNDGNAGNNPSFTVVEPTLTVTKTVSAPAADAGDSVTFTITITNGSAGTDFVAYDTTLSDVLLADLVAPTLLAGVGNYSATGFGAFTPPVVTDFEIIPAAPNNLLRVRPAFSLDMPPGASVMLRVQATLANTVSGGGVIVNKSDVFWTSTDGVNADERTGNSDPNPDTGTPDTALLDNYAISSSVTATVITPPIVSHSIVATSEAHTAGNNATIGEFVTYRTTVSLPEGVTNNLTIDTVLPAGYAYEPGSVTLIPNHPAPASLHSSHPGVTNGTVFNGSGLAAPTVTRILGAGNFQAGDDVRFTFASAITTNGDNNLDNNTFHFTWRALVLDAAGNDGLTPGLTTLAPAGTFVTGSVVAATVALQNIGGYALGGAVGTGSLSAGPLVLDGVTLVADDLVLVKNQTDQRQNGIYRVVAPGTGVNGAWERWVQFDQSNEITLNYRVEVVRGTGNGGTSYLQATSGVIVNTSNIVFSATPSTAILVDPGGATATVVEPALDITKGSSIATGNAGDAVTYTITVFHTAGSQSQACDLDLSDTIPPQITPTGRTATITVAGDADGSISLAGQNLTTTGVIHLAVGQTLTVTITGTLNTTVRPLNTITNTANLTYNTIVNGATAEQTDLISVAGGYVGSEDSERHTPDSASVNITTPFVPQISKTIFATSEAGSAGSDVLVGEIVRYELRVELFEGTNTLFTVCDLLPPGMLALVDQPVDIFYLNVGTSITGLGAGAYTNTANDAMFSRALAIDDDAYATGDDVFFKLGTLVNNDNDADAEFVVIRFNALVLNEAGNQNATTLSNNLSVLIDTDNSGQPGYISVDGNGGGATGVEVATDADNDGADAGDVPGVLITPVTVTVREPVLQIAKTITTSTAGLDAGDTVTYQIVVSHIGVTTTAHAYDVTVADTFPTQLDNYTLVSAVVSDGATNTNVAAAFNVTAAGVLTTTGTLHLLLDTNGANDQQLTLTVSGRIRDTITPGAVFGSTATVRYMSLPGTGTAPNGTGGATPGGSGATTGERDGSATPAVNDYTASAGVNATAVNPFSLAKSLAATSHTIAGGTAGADVAIGEVVTFELQVTLMEGTTSNLSIVDTLPAGLAYVPGSANISPNPATMTINTFAANIVGQVLTLSAVSVVNPGNVDAANTADTDSFFIRYQAVVSNVIGNQTTNTLINDADGSATGVLSDSNNAVTLTVREPVLTLSKTLTTSGLDAGDDVLYTLVLSNTGNAAAYDIRLLDTLDTDLILPTPGSAVAITVQPAGAYVTVNNSANTAAAVDAVLNELRVGHSVTVTITARVAQTSNPNNSVANSATATYTSLPGADVNERTGAGAPLNDYTVTAASLPFTLANPTIVKTVVNTANGLGASRHNAGNADVTIGEIITYDVTVTFTEGVTTAAVITDTAQSNATGRLEILTAVLQPLGTNLASTSNTVTISDLLDNAGAAGTNGINDTVTVNLGSVTNTFNNVADSGDQAVVTITARVVDASPNVDSRAISNSARLNYGTGGPVNASPVNVDVVEPRLSVIKAGNDADSVVNFGQTVTYTVTVSHLGSSTAPAYDVLVRDLLPAGLNLVVGSVVTTGTVVTGNTAGDTTVVVAFQQLNLATNVTITYQALVTASSGNLDNTAKAYWDSLPVDEAANTSGTYTADATPDRDYGAVAANEVFSANTDEPQDTERVSLGNASIADLVWYDLNADGVKDAIEPGLANVRVWIDLDGDGNYDATEPTAVTDINGLYLISNLAPGNYTVRVQNVPSGAIPTFDLDGTGTANRVDTSLIAGQNRTDVDWGYRGNASIGDLVWSDEDGNAVLNGAELGIDGVTLSLLRDLNGDGDALDPGEGVIATRVTAGGGTYIFTNLIPGSYLVDVTTVGILDGTTQTGATGVTDPEPVTVIAGQAYVDADFGYRGMGSVAGSVYYDVDNDGFRDPGEPGITGVTITLTGTNDVGHAVSLSMLTDVNGNYLFSNLHDGPYVITEPTEPAGYTDGTDTPGNLGGSTASTPDRINFTLTPGGVGINYNFGERFAGTQTKSIVGGVTTAEIGDIVRYRLVADLPQAALVDYQFRDNLPAGMQFLNDGNARVALVSTAGAAGTITSTAVAGAQATDPEPGVIPAIVLPDASVSASATINDDTYASGTDVFFKLGTLTNNEVDGNSEFVVIEFNAIVLDVAGNTNGTVLNNNFTVRFDQTGDTVADDSSTSNTVGVTVIEPLLQIVKSANDTTPHLGQTVTYTLTITHRAASTATAFDIELRDTVPAGLTLNAGSINVVGATVDSNTTAAPNIALRLNQLVVGNTISITYTAVVSTSAAIFGTTQDNTAKIYWDTQPVDEANNAVLAGAPDGTPDRDYGAVVANEVFNVDTDPAQDTERLTVVGADLVVLKDDGVVNVTPGQTLVYEINVSNVGTDDANNFTLTDTIPANTAFVSASPGGNFAAGVVTWTGQNLAAGATAPVGTYVVTVQVNATIPAGVFTLTNTATATLAVGETDPTPPNNTDDDVDNIIATPDLRIVKDDGGATVLPGGVVVYTLTYSNIGPRDATGVVINETVPPETTFNLAGSTAGWTFADGDPALTTGTFSIGNLASGASSTVAFAVRLNNTIPLGFRFITNTATINDDGAGGVDPTPLNNTSTDTTPIPTSDLSVTKAQDKNRPSFGETLVYTVTVNNAGPDPATGVTVRDALPAGLVYVSFTATKGSYDNVTGIWTVGGMPADTTETLTITTTVNTFVGVTNTAQVATCNEYDPDSTPDNDVPTEDDQASVTTLPQQINLSLVKDVDIPRPTRTQTPVFTITVRNAGPNTATGVVVTDVLPSGLEFIAAAPSQGTYNNPTGIWAIGTLPVDGSVTMQVTTRVTVLSTITNIAQITNSDQPDTDLTDNIDDATVIPQIADLKLTKTVAEQNADLNQILNYTITLTNEGPDEATNVAVTDWLPKVLQFISAAPSQGTFDSTTYVWQIGTLPVGATVTLQLVAKVIEEGEVLNVAEVTNSDQFDPDSTPNDSNPESDDQQGTRLDGGISEPIDLSCFGAKYNFTRRDSDRLLFLGFLELPSDFNPSGQSIVIQLAGFRHTCTLDKRGRFKSNTVQVELRKTQRRWRVALRVKKENLRDQMPDIRNIDADDMELAERSLTVRVGGKTFGVRLRPRFTARKDLGGSLTQ